MGKNGISALQLCGPLMVGGGLFPTNSNAIDFSKTLQAENFCLAFPCLSMYLQAQVDLPLPALTCLLTHQSAESIIPCTPGSISGAWKGQPHFQQG